jgi:hypothetical protein
MELLGSMQQASTFTSPEHFVATLAYLQNRIPLSLSLGIVLLKLPESRVYFCSKGT